MNFRVNFSISVEGYMVFHAPSLAGERFFSLNPWLLLDLTGLYWE
jgi:hypothetical protein